MSIYEVYGTPNAGGTLSDGSSVSFDSVVPPSTSLIGLTGNFDYVVLKIEPVTPAFYGIIAALEGGNGGILVGYWPILGVSFISDGGTAPSAFNLVEGTPGDPATAAYGSFTFSSPLEPSATSDTLVLEYAKGSLAASAVLLFFHICQFGRHSFGRRTRCELGVVRHNRGRLLLSRDTNTDPARGNCDRRPKNRGACDYKFRATRPVKWIGHRSIDCSRHPDPPMVWPIRVSMGAFGENVPSRDLWLSPCHNIAIDGALASISLLQNGKTVVQQMRQFVEYWHVELDAHDIVLAEGLPAESYLDTGNRTAFANGGVFIDAHPDFKPKHWSETCLPLVFEGSKIVRAKSRLLARLKVLGQITTSKAVPHLIADGNRIEPIELEDSRLAFVLPAGCVNTRLVSRTFIPSHAFAESTDSRVLGLCIERVQIDGQNISLDGENFTVEAGTTWKYLMASDVSAGPVATRHCRQTLES